MATTFSNHFVSFCPRPSTSGTHSRAVRSLEAPLSFRGNPSRCAGQRFPVLSSPSVTRQLPKAAVNISESNAQTVNGEEDDQVPWSNSAGQAEHKDIPTLKSLIQAYKEAILIGDEKSVSDIELAICTLEKERGELLNKVTEITADIASGRDKFLRSNAEFENFRKRCAKDRLSFTSDIQIELIESLLPIVDSFERSRQQIKPETEKEEKLDTSYQGIYKQFVEIMRSLRVGVIETVGRQFDPSMHEAIARVESRKYNEGFVVEEVCRGFVLGDQILRPAKVIVSIGSGLKKAPSEAEEPTEQPPVATG
uniref:GrpE protein homolog n=1 Tax=Anthurium amnicola TaxID=1678845 RepID=A0A1D1ZIV1_9ARAE